VAAEETIPAVAGVATHAMVSTMTSTPLTGEPISTQAASNQQAMSYNAMQQPKSVSMFFSLSFSFQTG
jgi:phosphoribosylcarboxyaminoimidazole (NCAIR) mutase